MKYIQYQVCTEANLQQQYLPWVNIILSPDPATSNSRNGKKKADASDVLHQITQPETVMFTEKPHQNHANSVFTCTIRVDTAPDMN